MNLKKIVLLLSLGAFLLPASALAQKRKLPRKAKEFSHQFKLSLFLDRDTANGGLMYGSIAPAYVNRNENGFWHTVELNKIIWNTTETEDGTTENRGAAFRHQFDLPIGPRWNILQLTLGTSERISYQRSVFEPTSSNQFRASIHDFRAQIGVIPAIHIYPIDRIDLGLGALFGILETALQSTRNEDPTIPAIQGRSEIWSSDLYLLRFQAIVLSAAIQF